ncbi:anti-sigma factor antagonist [Candidatus Aerophobetes bacterium]|uniref:Anti-sigma factor antagonist n=1 Tax=Aerophobetes bacterium TaxID=2030807 RepID=A0A523UWQ7_UNCAE|nr:MAG: anti-sigma factor antagonist [Candidatus Aerophobetes bacterium]
MQISRKEEKGIHIFSLDGRFDAHSAGDVEKELNLTISKGARKLLLDMDGVEYISSAGLRVLLAVAKKLKKEEGEIKICCLKPYVKEVFDIAGFTQIFKIYDTTEKAIQEF